MWLLEATTLKLKSFNSPPPRYLILSHTWGDDEVEFHDMADIEECRQKRGFAKIELACREATKMRLPYAWVDSCCIDKKSSAELSEAINSMFEWYRQAACCVALLSDLEVKLGQPVTAEELQKCRWFRRGWTLQELIAPSEVQFYNRWGDCVGTKDELCQELAEVTGIASEVLEDVTYAFGICVGQRMSWAAKRTTTRIEDMAYCLFGLFNVNMPLLYGEGENAFIRLQKAIAQEESDLTLFAWQQQTHYPNYRGLLARSPAEFISCSNLVRHSAQIFQEPTFTVGDFGLTLGLENFLKTDVDFEGEYSLDLLCFEAFRVTAAAAPSRSQGNLAILLRKVGDRLLRVLPHVRTQRGRFSDGVRFIVPKERTENSAAITLQTTVSKPYADFLEILLRRNLVIIHRKELANLMTRLESDFAKATEPRELCRQIDIEYSSTSDFLGLLAVSTKIEAGKAPIWWEHFRLQGCRSEVYIVVICGLSLNHLAPSEHLLPWFTILSSMDDHPIMRIGRWTGKERMVSDFMNLNFADSRGRILQEQLPTVASVTSEDGRVYTVRMQRKSARPPTFFAELQLEESGSL